MTKNSVITLKNLITKLIMDNINSVIRSFLITNKKITKFKKNYK
ncbi:MAG: hypothetical protein PWQ83_1098 [Thermosipho sp. (in: thermotogales)]|nr:hypothetical protein [Thermosipho sp. (in: thermotogales)]